MTADAGIGRTAGPRVWAPEAGRVELLVEGEQPRPLARGGDGWWYSPPGAEILPPGTRYGFSVDGGTPRPDPRSGSQPDGVDGWSAVVDHGAFVWTDGDWRGLPLPGAVLYELHVGTFTPEGTFDAAIGRLPHLRRLGVDAVELLPVVEFPGDRGWGYDGVDLFAPHHTYGGPEGLKRLVDACHGAGLGVVLDVVYNHLGPTGNHLREFAPYFSSTHETGWGPAVNFDGAHSEGVRRFVVDNALMWLRDYHADGLRLDAVHAYVDDSATHILEELAVEVDALAAHVRKPLFLVAESDRNDPRLVRSRDAGGYGLDGVWADDWHHALHAALTGERTGYYEDYGTIERLAKALRRAWVYDGTWSGHRQRRHGRPADGVGGSRFVVCTQNHDQTGNRAQGERLAALVPPARLRIAAALLFTSPFVPLLFQGEEWGASSPFQYFTDHRDPELARAVSEGRRREFAAFGWEPASVPDPQDETTFVRSRLAWAEAADGDHAVLLDWYRSLAALRREWPELTDPRLERVDVRFDEEARWLVVTHGSVLVAVNLGAATILPVPGGIDVLLASPADVRCEGEQLALPADAVVIGRTAARPAGDG